MKTLTFSKTTYTANYLIKNPARYAIDNKIIWEVSVEEYLRRNKFSFDKKDYERPLENIEFHKITKIYNSLIGKKSK